VAELDLHGAAVLVTGGAGFIGSHLVDALVERGARVKVLDNLSTGLLKNLAGRGDQIEFVEGDIRDIRACRSSCEGIDYVLHQAALGSVPRSMDDPATTVAVNVTGTANIFTAARDVRVRRIVYASSSSVYGDSDRLPKREGEEGRPLSPYALSKVVDEQLAAVFFHFFGMELIGLRYFNVYGQRQRPDGPYAAVIPRFFAACVARDIAVIHGDGEQSRDFTYVADAVAANLLALAAPAASCGRSYNVAPGQRTTINELVRMIATAMAVDVVPRHVAARPGDVRHSLSDPALARRYLDLPEMTPLDVGLRSIAESLRQREHEQSP
jgi:nucleoside-diphosphate-sugar epimerase